MPREQSVSTTAADKAKDSVVNFSRLPVELQDKVFELALIQGMSAASRIWDDENCMIARDKLYRHLTQVYSQSYRHLPSFLLMTCDYHHIDESGVESLDLANHLGGSDVWDREARRLVTSERIDQFLHRNGEYEKHKSTASLAFQFYSDTWIPFQLSFQMTGSAEYLSKLRKLAQSATQFRSDYGRLFCNASFILLRPGQTGESDIDPSKIDVQPFWNRQFLSDTKHSHDPEFSKQTKNHTSSLACIFSRNLTERDAHSQRFSLRRLRLEKDLMAKLGQGVQYRCEAIL